MNIYTIYFELFGKKMKTSIKANTKEDAIEKLRARLIICKVETEVPKPKDNRDFVTDFFNNILNPK